MSKDIWHKADEAPRYRFQCVFYHRNGKDYYFGEYDPTFRRFVSGGKFVLEHVEVWKFAFAEDIMSCLDELERTRKALDIAVDEITNIKVAAESVGIGFFMTAAIFALAKIKTALEQKE